MRQGRLAVTPDIRKNCGKIEMAEYSFASVANTMMICVEVYWRGGIPEILMPQCVAQHFNTNTAIFQ